ncbi:MAG: cytochrome c [Chromatiales bacterium]
MRQRLVAAGAGLLLSAHAGAADGGHGKELVEAHCLHCHNATMYTRPDRKVKDLKGLEKQVRRCELALELQWFDEDVADVAAYLNDTYYRFPR